MLSDTNDDALTEDRVIYWLAKKLDLSESDEWSPVFITPNHDTRALVAIDGNHRLMAHYLTHRSVEGVHAYLFSHPKTAVWDWFPHYAREMYFRVS